MARGSSGSKRTAHRRSRNGARVLRAATARGPGDPRARTVRWSGRRDHVLRRARAVPAVRSPGAHRRLTSRTATPLPNRTTRSARRGFGGRVSQLDVQAVHGAPSSQGAPALRTSARRRLEGRRRHTRALCSVPVQAPWHNRRCRGQARVTDTAARPAICDPWEMPSDRSPVRREPPRFRRAEIASSEPVTRWLQRVTIEGPELTAIRVVEPVERAATASRARCRRAGDSAVERQRVPQGRRISASATHADGDSARRPAARRRSRPARGRCRVGVGSDRGAGRFGGGLRPGPRIRDRLRRCPST